MTKKIYSQRSTKNLRPYFEDVENDENMAEILRISSLKGGLKTIYKAIKVLIAQWLQEGGLPAAMEKIRLLPFDFLKINLPAEIGLSSDTINKTYEAYNLKELETLLDCPFRQPFWLIRGLSRETSPHFNITGYYMHMAFFGDAVMNVFAYLYLIKKSKSSKQDFTEHHSKLISNEFFAKLGVKFGLNKYLIRDPETPKINGKIRDNSKRNADLWEAVAGAMFIELDLDFEKFYSKMANLISEEMEEEIDGRFVTGNWGSSFFFNLKSDKGKKSKKSGSKKAQSKSHPNSDASSFDIGIWDPNLY